MASLLTLSIGIGLLVGILFIELFSLFCGGVIVPGYIALHLNNPFNVVATLLIALITFWIVKGIGFFTLLYGRRQYVAILLIAFILGAVFDYFIQQFSLFNFLNIVIPGQVNDHFGVIGFVIPGLIANWFERQGILITGCTVIVGAILVRLSLLSLNVIH